VSDWLIADGPLSSRTFLLAAKTLCDEDDGDAGEASEASSAAKEGKRGTDGRGAARSKRPARSERLKPRCSKYAAQSTSSFTNISPYSPSLFFIVTTNFARAVLSLVGLMRSVPDYDLLSGVVHVMHSRGLYDSMDSLYALGLEMGVFQFPVEVDEGGKQVRRGKGAAREKSEGSKPARVTRSELERLNCSPVV